MTLGQCWSNKSDRTRDVAQIFGKSNKHDFLIFCNFLSDGSTLMDFRKLINKIKSRGQPLTFIKFNSKRTHNTKSLISLNSAWSSKQRSMFDKVIIWTMFTESLHVRLVVATSRRLKDAAHCCCWTENCFNYHH